MDTHRIIRKASRTTLTHCEAKHHDSSRLTSLSAECGSFDHYCRDAHSEITKDSHGGHMRDDGCDGSDDHKSMAEDSVPASRIRSQK